MRFYTAHILVSDRAWDLYLSGSLDHMLVLSSYWSYATFLCTPTVNNDGPSIIGNIHLHLLSDKNLYLDVHEWKEAEKLLPLWDTTVKDNQLFNNIEAYRSKMSNQHLELFGFLPDNVNNLYVTEISFNPSRCEFKKSSRDLNEVWGSGLSMITINPFSFDLNDTVVEKEERPSNVININDIPRKDKGLCNNKRSNTEYDFEAVMKCNVSKIRKLSLNRNKSNNETKKNYKLKSKKDKNNDPKNS